MNGSAEQQLAILQNAEVYGKLIRINMLELRGKLT